MVSWQRSSIILLLSKQNLNITIIIIELSDYPNVSSFGKGVRETLLSFLKNGFNYFNGCVKMTV